MANLALHNAQAVVHVVDDDLAMRVALESTLRSVGYSVQLYETGSALIEQATDGLSGCIVLDVRLPGPGGLEVQRRLRDMGLDLPIIFITGHGDVEMAVRAMKANAIEFLTKPFREQDLLDAISAAMEASGARARLLGAREAAQQRLRSLSARGDGAEKCDTLGLRHSLHGARCGREAHWPSNRL